MFQLAVQVAQNEDVWIQTSPPYSFICLKIKKTKNVRKLSLKILHEKKRTLINYSKILEIYLRYFGDMLKLHAL